jgi:anthranilate/para-aminobenzoate synthase component I
MTKGSLKLPDGEVLALARAAAAVAAEPGGVWLDGGNLGRSWLALRPIREWRGSDPAVLAEVEMAWRNDTAGIILGWITYEFGVGALLGSERHPALLPSLCFRQFSDALRIEANGDTHGIGDWRQIAQLANELAHDCPVRWPFSNLQPLWPRERYDSAFLAIQEEIAAGNTYQVNLSQPFFSPWKFTSSPSALAGAYLDLRERAPAELGALISVGDGRWIVSNSPETLLHLREENGTWNLRSLPIKGTRPRHADTHEDRRAAAQLLASSKDRAEHVMIVDLVRNDLGRIARIGSVRADFTPQCLALPTVHHLVSEVSATIEASTSFASILRAIFPGGSITGTPKKRTMEIIAGLEEEARGIYCGAIVALSAGEIRASIPIRTALVDANGLHLRSGGGIVADSELGAEYAETLAKARAFAG